MARQILHPRQFHPISFREPDESEAYAEISLLIGAVPNDRSVTLTIQSFTDPVLLYQLGGSQG